MNSPKLSNIRKELNSLPPEALTSICLRLAKYKTENKELLNYLLFYNDNKEEYVNEVKQFLDDSFSNLPYSDYTTTKVLRKATRLMNKHIKFIGDKHQEVGLSLYFCTLFIEKKIIKTNHKPLIGLLFRQLKRSDKIIPKLEDDLQFDFQNEFDTLLESLKDKRPSFSLYEIK